MTEPAHPSELPPAATRRLTPLRGAAPGHDPHYDVIVVGAGAAGLLAAGRAAELGARVLLLEKMQRAGRKLLLTGKGRCNITNVAPMSEFLKHIHPNSQFLGPAFAGFFSDDMIRLLHDNGCETVVERGGRVFPASGKSADVLNALLQWLKTHHVEIRYGQRVRELVLHEGRLDGLAVQQHPGSHVVRTKAVVLCTGGMSYPATGSNGDGYRLATCAGHAIEPPRPALVAVETAGNVAQRLQGLSLKNVMATVWVNGRKTRAEFGEMGFTESGLSGPIILTLSRLMVDELRNNSRLELSIDLKPALDATKLENRLLRDLTQHGPLRMAALCRKWLPAAMIPVFLDRTGIPAAKTGQQLSPLERRAILGLMKDFRLTITGHRPFQEAIITAGGVLTAGIQASTMESKCLPGLYFAGELIDLDADTGGFNLQIAFSTGWLAAQACVAALAGP